MVAALDWDDSSCKCEDSVFVALGVGGVELGVRMYVMVSRCSVRRVTTRFMWGLPAYVEQAVGATCWMSSGGGGGGVVWHRRRNRASPRGEGAD
jgi:hypothetical protein